MFTTPSLRSFLFLGLLLALTGAGCFSFTTEKSPGSSSVSDPALLLDDPDTVGWIEPWYGPFLGDRDADVWLVSHTKTLGTDRPILRGTINERGSSRRGNLMSQTVQGNQFTFSFNWGPEEGDQGYGTTTHRQTNGEEDVLEGEVSMGSSTRNFTLKRNQQAPSFVLHRVATSTKEGDREPCSFDLEYPVLQASDTVSRRVADIINTKIVQYLHSSSTSLEREAEDFLRRCTTELTDLRKDTTMSDWARDINYVQTVEPEVVFGNEKIVSLLFLNYSYTGGAHGNYGYSAITFDLTTGDEVLLQDLVQTLRLKSFYQQVSRKLVDQGRDLLFQETIGAIEGFLQDKAQSSEVEQREQYGHLDNWYLTRQGIVFFYNPYEVAPYAAGVQEVMLPFSEWSASGRADALKKFALIP